MLNFNCPGSISWFHSYVGGKWGESRQGGDSLGHLSGTMGKSGKTLDKFSVQISNEKEQRKLRKAALLSSTPHNTKKWVKTASHPLWPCKETEPMEGSLESWRKLRSRKHHYQEPDFQPHRIHSKVIIEVRYV